MGNEGDAEKQVEERILQGGLSMLLGIHRINRKGQMVLPPFLQQAGMLSPLVRYGDGATPRQKRAIYLIPQSYLKLDVTMPDGLYPHTPVAADSHGRVLFRIYLRRRIRGVLHKKIIGFDRYCVVVDGTFNNSKIGELALPDAMLEAILKDDLPLKLPVAEIGSEEDTIGDVAMSIAAMVDRALRRGVDTQQSVQRVVDNLLITTQVTVTNTSPAVKQ